MKKINWSIRQDGKHIDSGTIEAVDDKNALAGVMSIQDDGRLAPDKSYTFTAGELTASSYGDELERSARVTQCGMDEDAPMDAPHHFQPNPADVGLDPYSLDRKLREAQEDADKIIANCPHNDIGTVVGTLDQVCLDCGAPIRAGTPVDTGAARKTWITDAATAKKIAREKLAGRRTFTPNEAAEIVKRTAPRSCDLRPVGQPNTRRNPTRQRVGPDPIVGRALTSGQKGDVIEVELDTPGSRCKLRCAEDVAVGERLRVQSDGRCYGAPRGAVLPDVVVRVRPGDVIRPFDQSPTGRVANGGPAIQQMPPPDAVRDARRKAFGFMPLPDENQIQAQHIFDKAVRAVAQHRQDFANMRGVPIDQVEVSFVHDEPIFSVKD